MRINNNLMAMNTHRQLGINQSAGAKSIEKLSSGYRINRAGDDAAGLAISEKMRAQVRGLNQASRNSQDAISLVQTAEGALNESQAILQRMRELAVQSANDTNEGDDRTAIQNEIDQLTSEVNRISETTEFNKKKLLNGDLAITGDGKVLDGAVVPGTTAVTGITPDVDSTLAAGDYDVVVTSTTVSKIESTGQTSVDNADVTNGAVVDGLAGDAYKIEITNEIAKGITSNTNVDNVFDIAGGNTAVTIESNSTIADGNATLDIVKRQISSDNLSGSIALDVSGVKLDGYGSGSYTVTTSREFDASKVSDAGAGTGGVNLLAGGAISGFAVAESATGAEANTANTGYTLTVNITAGTVNGDADIEFTDGTETVTVTTSSTSNGAQTIQLGGVAFDVDIDEILADVTNIGTGSAVDVSASDYDGATITLAANAVQDVVTVTDGTNTGTAKSLSDNGAGQAMSVTVGTETLDFTIDQSTLTHNETLSTTIQSQYSITLEDSGTNQVGAATVVNELQLTDPDVVKNISFGASGVLVDLDVAGLQALTSQVAAHDETIVVGTSKGYTAQLQLADGTNVTASKVTLDTAAAGGTKIEIDKGVELTYTGADLLTDVSLNADGNGQVFFGVQDDATEFTMDLKHNGGASIETVKIGAGDDAVFADSGVTVTTDNSLATGTADFKIKNDNVDKSVKMQIGANTGQNIAIDISDVGSSALKISSGTGGATESIVIDGKTYTAKFNTSETVTADGEKTEFSLDISDHDNATAAIHVITNALTSISDTRAKLGAVQNRLEHTIKNLDTSAENLQASESRIRDVDMAKEMMEFTKNNILSQAAQSMLAQANQAPQGVLQLLR